LTITIAASPPAGVTALSSVARATRSLRSPASAGYTALAYVELEPVASIFTDGGPAFTFTLPSVISGDQYLLAWYFGDSWNYAEYGPATVNGDTVSFPAGGADLSLTGGQVTTLALYAAPPGTVTPTPTPTATPTPTPVPTPVASPTSIAFDLNASPTPAPLAVSETGYAGSFTSAIVCTESPTGQTPAALPFVAEISPASGTTFTVTPGNETGSCTVTITDANSASITVPVTVSETNVGVFGAQRKQ
jgi:cell division septation protein DedD